MHIKQLVIGFVVLANSYGIVHASEQLSTEAIVAYRAGNYEAALAAFLRLKNDSGQHHYNIGVCYYRLERYAEARQAFIRATEDKTVMPLAYYNLALIAAKLNQTEEAKQWLQQMNSATEDADLLALAGVLSNRLKGEGATDRWETNISLGSGYDDNILLTADNNTAVSSRGDGTYDMDAMVLASITTGKRRWRLAAGGFGQHYLTNNTYDMATLYARAGHQFGLGAGRSELATTVVYAAVGGQSFSASSEITANWLLPLASRMQVQFDVSATRIDALNAKYTSMDGWRERATIAVVRAMSAGRWVTSYQIEFNQRQTTSGSPSRHTIAQDYHHRFTPHLQLTGNIAYRYSDYETVRTENRVKAGMSLDWRLSKAWEIAGQVAHLTNLSDAAASRYRQNEARLTVSLTL